MLTLQVNDMYATSSDPQAWEFRHPLFRRGEPHLLAQIKRKSTRPSQAEGSVVSPTDETSDTTRAVAGWMRDAGNTSMRVNSPPREVIRPPVYGHNLLTGETIQPRQVEETRTPAHTFWDNSRPPNTAMSTGRIPEPPPRFHPDPSRPPLTAQRYVAAPYPESPYYPQPQQPSPVSSLSSQVAFLEERTQRLSELINTERIQHVRSSLETNTAMMTLVNCIGSQGELSTDQRGLYSHWQLSITTR
jgi:hypothetical protein